MNGFPDFSYSVEQWDRIAACVVKLRGVDDTQRIPRKGGPTLRMLIELEAGMFCGRGFLKRRKARKPSPHSQLDRLAR